MKFTACPLSRQAVFPVWHSVQKRDQQYQSDFCGVIDDDVGNWFAAPLNDFNIIMLVAREVHKTGEALISISSRHQHLALITTKSSAAV